MFGWIGDIFDCLLGKNRRIIANQSNTIMSLKTERSVSHKRITKLEADAEANRDVAHKAIMETVKAQDELAAERSKHGKLLQAQEDIFLDQLRIEKEREAEKQARTAENALKEKIKNKAKAKKDGPKLDDDDLL